MSHRRELKPSTNYRLSVKMMAAGDRLRPHPATAPCARFTRSAVARPLLRLTTAGHPRAPQHRVGSNKTNTFHGNICCWSCAAP
jgi:hypothetical protein